MHDRRLWAGEGAAPPGTPPASLARRGPEDAAAAYASAKRWWWFFEDGDEPDRLVSSASDALAFLDVLRAAQDDPDQVRGAVAERLNRYRLGLRDDDRVHVSRHHSLAAHRRTTVLAAAARVDLDALRVRTPYRWEARRYCDAGFLADRLLVGWDGVAHTLPVTYATWRILGGRRALSVQREHEAVDFALDLLMAQAPVAAAADAVDIDVFDHRARRHDHLRVNAVEQTIAMRP